MKELGRIGQKRWDGTFSEEFLKELVGRKGVEVYREMERNDDTIGAILFAIKMLIRQVRWTVEPGGESAKDKEAAEFVESCLHDMASTWTDTISEILSFLVYGWSYHEIVYKRRNGKSKIKAQNSKYTDGLIGWAKLPIRSQDTLWKWEYEQENLVGMTQMPPPDYGLYTIPITKALHFRTESAKDNPEGRSILRNAYRSWFFKRRIQELEAIGIERDATGLPWIKVPEGLNIWDKDDVEAQAIYHSLVAMVKNIRRNEYEGLVLPGDYEIQLLNSGGQRQFDTNAIIKRYDTAIAKTVLADFIDLGHEAVGSYALSDNKTQMFTMALSAFVDIICETFNSQGIPPLIDLNGSHFSGIEDYPKLSHGEIDNVDLTMISKYISDLVGAGVLIPDEPLEDYLREVADLPERTEIPDQRQSDPVRDAQRRAASPSSGNVDPDENEDIDEVQVEEAKKRLGRGDSS